jgi:hypothetical protein
MDLQHIKELLPKHLETIWTIQIDYPNSPNRMKIFLDDFTMYSDMENHLQKLKFCFQKCKKIGINLNLDNCAFMVFSRMILGFRGNY